MVLCSGATLRGRQCREGYFAFALLQSKIRLIDYYVQVLCSERYARPHDDDHLSSIIFGASLSEPHTYVKYASAVCMCIYMCRTSCRIVLFTHSQWLPLANLCRLAGAEGFWRKEDAHQTRLIDYCVQVLHSEEGNAGKATSHSPSYSLKHG